MTSLPQTLATERTRPFGNEPYVGYAYAYPHKTAYRMFDRAPYDGATCRDKYANNSYDGATGRDEFANNSYDLAELWQAEGNRPTSLYIHVPFCEFRCGFCNLFTLAQPAQSMVDRWFSQLQDESLVVSQAVGKRSIARVAIGGGTPTQLSLSQLSGLFAMMQRDWSFDPREVPVSVEASPHTVDNDKLALLRAAGVERISLGVQSFDAVEAAELGRPQKRREVETALDAIRRHEFPVLNIDLIYGAVGQTPRAFAEQTRTALAWSPEEIYLYPLYVRPLTGLDATSGRADRATRSWSDDRLDAYNAGRDTLLAHGYEQVSMRMFRRVAESPGKRDASPVYCCQNDGMIGLGCGARSYTQAIHYSSEYAVGKPALAAIVQRYIEQPVAEFRFARYGFSLDEAEQQRRFAIVSLLQKEGLDLVAFKQRFGVDALTALPQLQELVEHAWASVIEDRLVLTDEGLAWSDAIGPWLYSPDVQAKMREYELK